MKILPITQSTEALETDLFIFPFFHTDKKTVPAHALHKTFGKHFQEAIKRGDFHGKEREQWFVYPEGSSGRILLLGLGDEKALTEDKIRLAYASAVKTVQKHRWKEITLLPPERKSGHSHARDRELAVEGALLAMYRYDRFKTEAKEPPVEIEKIQVLGKEKAWSREISEWIQKIEAVNYTRDLVNGNAYEVTPEFIAREALSLKGSHLSVTILDKKALEKEKMGLLLAVAKGSAVDPRLVVMEYKPPKAKGPLIAVIGKGVTYDTGGLNLKPTGSMEDMRCDMSGAAAVLGLMKALKELAWPVQVVGVIPATENAIGSRSYKPGDVYTSHSGKTVEITNTDAEGRLILADAFSYVQKHYKPQVMVDLATLTGAMVIALGEEASGMYCNDEQLSKALTRAGEKTHERVWSLPLFEEYRESMKSSIADIKNSGPRRGSPSLAAIFLQKFIHPDVAWAHLDIAGTAFLHAPRGYHQTQATGVGVRLLLEYLAARM